MKNADQNTKVELTYLIAAFVAIWYITEWEKINFVLNYKGGKNFEQ